MHRPNAFLIAFFAAVRLNSDQIDRQLANVTFSNGWKNTGNYCSKLPNKNYKNY